MIVYFSGTGNSRYAAALLADQLGDAMVDAGQDIKAGTKADYHSETPWIFVSPTYGWQLPRVFEAYIRNGIFDGNKTVYFVMTCGQDIGRPEKSLVELCRVKGLDYHGVLEVVMPENYIAMFSAPEEAEAAEIIQAAHPVLEAGAEKIRQGRPFPSRSTGSLARLKSGPINSAFYALFVKAKAFKTTEDCTGCGACVKACPLNNIVLEEKRPLWGKDCTHCMACICGCPHHAIEYGRKSRGKPRYQCPKYEG